MAEFWNHFQATSEDPKAVVCTTCHTKLSKNSESVLQRHLKTSKHMKSLSKLRRGSSISSVKKPKLLTQEKTEIFQPKMEDLLVRFPYLAGEIFDFLEDKSLASCQMVSRSWKDFCSPEKFFLIRIINGEVGYFHKLGDDWKKVFDKAKTETIMDLRHAVGQFYDKSDDDLTYHNGLTPSHVAAGTGNLELLKSIEKITKNNNPKDGEGCTLLHYAAQNGHLNVLKYVMELVDNKNPECDENEDLQYTTPLEIAAYNENWEICEYMLENIEGILSPKTSNWKSEINPFFVAAKIGNLKLCKIIMENIDNADLNNIEHYFKSACVEAVEQGHWKVVNLIGNYSEKKFENAN